MSKSELCRLMVGSSQLWPSECSLSTPQQKHVFRARSQKGDPAESDAEAINHRVFHHAAKKRDLLRSAFCGFNSVHLFCIFYFFAIVHFFFFCGTFVVSKSAPQKCGSPGCAVWVTECSIESARVSNLFLYGY